MRRGSEHLLFGDLTFRSFLCSWLRPEAGFEWLDGQDGAGPWLIPRSGVGTKPFARRYGPMGQTGLYKRFAELKDQDAIRVFANDFGLLEGRTLIDGTIGDRLELWQRHIRSIRFLAQLWEWVRDGQRVKLEPYVWWQHEPRCVWRHFVFVDGGLHERSSMRAQTAMKGSGYEAIVAQGAEALAEDETKQFEDAAEHFVVTQPLTSLSAPVTNASILKDWTYGDVFEPTRDYLIHEVNKKIKRRLSPRLLPLRPGALYFEVDCLLGALYLQLQLDIAGGLGAEHKECATPGCAEPTDAPKRYCAACRMDRDLERKRRSYQKHKNDWPSTRRKGITTTPITTPKPV